MNIQNHLFFLAWLVLIDLKQKIVETMLVKSTNPVEHHYCTNIIFQIGIEMIQQE